MESKKLNYRRIYEQVVKYGKTIPEIAKEYMMDEESFIERIKKGLDSKLYSTAMKANDRNIKKPQSNSKKEALKAVPESVAQISSETALETKTTVTDTNNKQEENEMARFEERREQKYRQKQSRKDKEIQKEKKQEKSQTTDLNNMSILEKKKDVIISEISEKKKALDESTQILAIREERVVETQKVFDEAKKALEESKSERDKAKQDVEEQEESIENIKAKLKDIEAQITELRNKSIYLVAPGFIGKRPLFGTFYSTVKVKGFDSLSVVTAEEEYYIEPEIKDMVFAGYDSYKEYMEGLLFVMLCLEYTFKDIEYTVLVSDERLKRLLKKHIE